MRKKLTKSTFTGITVIITAIMMVLFMTACGTANENSTYTFKNLASKEGVFEVRDLELDLGLEEADSYKIISMQLVEDTICMLVKASYGVQEHILYYTVDLEGKVLDSNRIYDNYAEACRDVLYKSILPDGSVIYIETDETGGCYDDLLNYDLVHCDRKGQEIRRIMLAKKEGSYLFDQILEGKENHLILISDNLIYDVDYRNGTLEKWATPELVKKEYVFMTEQGIPYIILHNEDYSVASYRYIDLHSGTLLGECQEAARFQEYSVSQDENSGYDYVLEDLWGIYGYQEATDEIVPVLDYLSSDVYFEEVEYWLYRQFVDEDHFITVQQNRRNPDKNNRLLYCSRVAPEDVPDRESIVLATNNFREEFREKIVEFNKNNDKYRISIALYRMEYPDGNAIPHLEEIAYGNKNPDLFFISSWSSVEDYEEQEYFADVYEMMEQDKAFRQKDYCMNVFQACENNGKLYRIPIGFMIETAIGKASIFTKDRAFTWEALEELQQAYPEAVVYGEMSRQELTDRLLKYAEEELTEEESKAGGQQYAEKELTEEERQAAKLQKIQAFAADYPEELEEMLFVDFVDYRMLAGEDYVRDRILMVPKTVYSVMSLRQESYGYFREDTVPVGFPDEEGKGSTLSAGASFAISAASANKEGAWEVIKYFLSKKVQMEGFDNTSEAYGLPVYKKALKHEFLSLTEELYVEDTGSRRDPDYWVWNGYESVVLPTFSKKTALRWYDFICSY